MKKHSSHSRYKSDENTRLSLGPRFLLLGWCIILSACMVLVFSNSADTLEDQTFRADLTESIDGATRNCGHTEFIFSKDQKTIDYTIYVNSISDIHMAHLHFGKAGEIGSPVVWLYPESPPPIVKPGEYTGVLIKGSFSASDLIGPLRGRSMADLVRYIREGRIYVNIHTVKNPESAVSGIVE